MLIDYFYHTAAKKWQIVDAICHYDSGAPYGSFVDVLQALKKDLSTVGQTQISLKKNAAVLERQVQKLLDLHVHENPTFPENTNEPNDDHLPNNHVNNNDGANNVPLFSSPHQRPDSINVSDTFNNNGQVIISTSTVSLTGNNINGKKRSRENDSPRDSSNSGHSITVREPLTESTNLSPARTLSLNEGKVHYSMTTPSAEAETPHRPKLRRTQLDALVKLFHFGTSFSSNNPLTTGAYKAMKEEQRKNASLKALQLFDTVAWLLQDVSFDTFNNTLWKFMPDENTHPDGITDESLQFLEIMKHSLCFFRLVCLTTPVFAQNHERTHFVENVIPSLLALAKISGFIEFNWCETPFSSSKCLNLQEYNYDRRSAPASKLIDALGILKTQNNMELVIVEASSGSVKENTTHSIEDSLKMLECGVSSLRKELAQYPNASLATFQKLKVFSLQIIKTQVTLSEMSLYDRSHWKFIETRTATLPTNWDDRISFLQYLELLATLFDGIRIAQQVQKQLLRENVGLCDYDGPSTESINHAARNDWDDFSAFSTK